MAGRYSLRRTPERRRREAETTLNGGSSARMTRRIAVNEDVAPADDEEAGRKPSRPADDGVGLEGDWANIFVLLLLYTLQGIPMGLASSVPLILQEKGATYMQQAGFDIVSYPFSLTLLWAPLVDSLFIQRFGRRKTWLVPVQIAVCHAWLVCKRKRENKRTQGMLYNFSL